MVREQLMDRGIRDTRVLEAMIRVPRHVFLDRDAGSEAYSDHSFPIGYAQTMSAPYMVGYMCEQLGLTGSERVLEIGTGSGYHAAVLSGLAREVYTIERVRDLARRAEAALRDGLFSNVQVLEGDGSRGWPEAAPFDRILVTAAARQVPAVLLAQLREGGMFLGPVEKEDGSQEIVRLLREGDTFTMQRLIGCAFVPLVREVPVSAAEAAAVSVPQGEGHAG